MRVMKGIDALFLRIAVLYVIAGMALGIFMAVSEDHTMMPAHAHMNLLGWVSMALYAGVYRIWPETAQSPLARWHFWLANIGTLTAVVGIAGIMGGYPDGFGPVAGIGSILALASMLLFAAIVYARVPLARSAESTATPLRHGTMGAAD
jgi:heme/copper-type cytochrome/quinol oxidase subunit 1